LYDGDDDDDFVYTGDSLKDASLVDVTEALERGKSTLVTFGLEWCV